MVKRKFKSNKESDDEYEFQSSAKQFKKKNKSITETSYSKRVSLPLNEEQDSNTDSDDGSSMEVSNASTDDSPYESFSSFMKAFSFDAEVADERQKLNGTPINSTERRKSHGELSLTHASSSHGSKLEEEQGPNIRILSVPSKLSEVVSLQHPATLTLHGYVKVSVQLGSISIFGYRLKEGANINVFSTEGTGLKQVITLKSMHKSTVERFAKTLKKMACYEDVDDIEEFLENIGPKTVVLIVEKVLLPAPLQFLELYYPYVLQAKMGLERMKLEKKDQDLDQLCSSEKSCVINIDEDWKTLSEEVSTAIRQSEGAESRPHILIFGPKNSGKSTLIRYLMNSSLNNHPVLYFLDTDPGQTEYTPAGVISLVRVTKPLLGPPFAHQKKPIKMIFLGSVTAGTSPALYQESVKHLMKYFYDNFPEETLFVNTMGWLHGIGALCLEKVKEYVKPTMLIEINKPEINSSMTKEVLENDVTLFKVSSKAPSKSSSSYYQPAELRNFNLVAYLGQCQKSYMPTTPINSFRPHCVSWDNIALYVMGKKVPAHRLVEAMHCSIVALCHVDLSYVLKSDNPEFPMTLCDEPVCECLGFGLVRASDETNNLFYVVTPLTLDQLKNVNALIKGNITIPHEMMLKQNILNKPLPFTDDSEVAKTPARKAVRKRAFRNVWTPTQTT